jgi:hypothetical protein
MADPVAPRRRRLVVTDHAPAFQALPEQLLRVEGDAPLVPPTPRGSSPFIRAVRPAAVGLDLPPRREPETLATLDSLRRDPATAAIPVVVCTTTPGAPPGLVAREGAGLHVLAEPFDLDRLPAMAPAPSPARGRPE